MKNLLTTIILILTSYSNGYPLPIKQDSVKVDSISAPCSRPGYYLKIIPVDRHRIYGLGISYWNVPFNFPCDQITVNGVYLDVNPVSNILGTPVVELGILFYLLGASEEYDKTSDNDIKSPVNIPVSVRGLALSGYNFVPYNYTGVNLNILGLTENGYGLSISVLGSYYGNMDGLSISCLSNICDNFNGISVSGFANISKNGRWLSLSGLVNTSKKFTGIQIALYNNCSDLKGFQIGLWNSNGKRSLPLINWQF